MGPFFLCAVPHVGEVFGGDVMVRARRMEKATGVLLLPWSPRRRRRSLRLQAGIHVLFLDTSDVIRGIDDVPPVLERLILNTFQALAIERSSACTLCWCRSCFGHSVPTG